MAESINIIMCKASKEKERKGGSQNALEIIFLRNYYVSERAECKGGSGTI